MISKFDTIYKSIITLNASSILESFNRESEVLYLIDVYFNKDRNNEYL